MACSGEAGAAIRDSGVPNEECPAGVASTRCESQLADDMWFHLADEMCWIERA